MPSDTAFASGIAQLCVNFNREPTEELSDLYFSKVKALSDEAWARAVGLAIDQETFFPVVATLLKLAKPKADDAEKTAEAVKMFGRVQWCSSYNPRTGSSWHASKIERELGPAAALAFEAAGGDSAFGNLGEGSRDLPFVRKAFVEAYKAAVADEGAKPAQLVRREQTLTRLPSGRLGVIEDRDVEIGHDEAARLLHGEGCACKGSPEWEATHDRQRCESGPPLAGKGE